MRPELPTGTVTFLFTDVEGSTRLLDELGAEAYADALAEHRQRLREAFSRHGGSEVDTQGDAFFVAFPTAEGAVRAATEAQEALAGGPIRVRMGIHTGTPLLTSEGYVGPDVHRAARIAAAGHGGQVLVSAATAGLLPDASLHDLGEHRLKDLSGPERIYQLADGEFPPLNTLFRTNLPVPVTSFHGREHELAAVTALIARDGVRLVTLTGPGGTGKTRLALAAAGASAEQFSDGVWWVSLSPLRDPSLVLTTAASVLGASGGLVEHIGDRRLLLLLDNFEHVVEAAGDVGELLARCPNLSVLVTSREVLQVPGEQAYPVPSLQTADGVELFLTRAAAVRPDFSGDGAIAELCARLDNLPLAIELAAARVRMLSTEQLLARLGQQLDLLKGGRGVGDRQQTLRATIEWSYDLLTDDEQRLFARLSIFRGGWTLEAAERVCDADLDILQSLVDKSLVRVRDERFFMLETIRQYATERLEASGEIADLRGRHAQQFALLARSAEPHLREDRIEWLDRLDAERDNLRAALDRLQEAADAEPLLEMAGDLQRYWYLRGHIAEGKQRLEHALTADQGSTRARAKALRGASVMALNLADGMTAEARATQALELDRQLGDEWGEAYSLMMISNALAEQKRWIESQHHLEQAIRAFDALDDQTYALLSRANLARLLDDQGAVDRARELHYECLARARALGNQRMEAFVLSELAYRAREDGQLGEAETMLRDAIRIEYQRGQVMDVAIELARLAAVVVRAGRPHEAARLLGASLAMGDAIGMVRPSWDVERNDETMAMLSHQLGAVAATEVVEEGRRLTTGQAVALALGQA